MIDIENHHQLVAYLQQSGLLRDRDLSRCTNLHGGVSNRTVRVDFADGDSWVIKQALSKLRVSADWFSDPRRIHIEAEGLRWLARLIGPESVPAFVYESHDQQLLVMTAVPDPHVNFKELLLTSAPDSHHMEEFALLLTRLHGNGYEHHEPLAQVFADVSFFENLRLDPYYLHAARQLPEAAPFLARLVEGTRKRRLTLVHGDFSPKNILICNGRLILLDHEVIHFGDPAFDVGFSLAHLLSKAHHLSHRRRAFIDASLHYWNNYLQRCGHAPWAGDLEAWCIDHTLGCLLARAAGKSPLEYLNHGERAAQRMTVKRLIDDRPSSMPDLIKHFTDLLDDYE